MTKIDIVERIQNKFGFSKAASFELLESLVSILKDTVEAGEDVKVSGFGSFEVRNKDSRAGRNPQTGEAITIEARKILTFKPSKKLKAAINGER